MGKKSDHLSVCLDHDDYSKFMKGCEEYNLNKSRMVGKMIREYFKDEPRESEERSLDGVEINASDLKAAVILSAFWSIRPTKAGIKRLYYQVSEELDKLFSGEVEPGTYVDFLKDHLDIDIREWDENMKVEGVGLKN